jgi:hypothetical protein
MLNVVMLCVVVPNKYLIVMILRMVFFPIVPEQS